MVQAETKKYEAMAVFLKMVWARGMKIKTPSWHTAAVLSSQAVCSSTQICWSCWLAFRLWCQWWSSKGIFKDENSNWRNTDFTLWKPVHSRSERRPCLLLRPHWWDKKGHPAFLFKTVIGLLNFTVFFFFSCTTIQFILLVFAPIFALQAKA